MWSFPTCDGSALQLPHMLRARGWKEKKSNKPLKINLALFPGYMDVLLSVHFPEHFISYFSYLGVHNQKVSFLVSSAGFFITFGFYYIVCTLPKDPQVLSVNPVMTGTIIYIFHSHRMTESVDSVQRLECASRSSSPPPLLKAETTRAILYPVLGLHFVT